MTLGALVDVGVPLELIDEAIQSLGIPGLRLEAEQVRRHAMRALKVHVHCPHEHSHRHLSDILAMIEHGVGGKALTRGAAELAAAIFTRLAEAEAKVHGMPLEKVHFHEVGAADSIADIVGAAVGLDYLELDAIYASAVPTGTGTIKIAHGTCSIPAPATAELLRGVPVAVSQVPFELTTPTGAAILKTVVKAFVPVPGMTIATIGYGAGGRDLPDQANLLRLMIGESVDPAEWENHTIASDQHYHGHSHDHSLGHEHRHGDHLHEHDDHSHDHKHEHQHEHKHEHEHHDAETVWVLETNIDDMAGEMIGYCISRLWEANPLDLFSTAIQMKKQRPGVKLTLLCRKNDIPKFETLLFRHTSTLGIRRWPVERTVLEREKATVTTKWGEIQGKIATLPDGSTRFTPEFDSAQKIAEDHDIPLADVYFESQKSFENFCDGKK